MQAAGRVQRLESERELAERVAQPIDVAIERRRFPAGRARRPADPAAEIDALDQLHGEEPAVLIGNQLVEGDQVRVGDVGEGAKLVLEPVEPGGIESLQRLQGDFAPMGEVPGAIHHPHRPRADPRHDLETSGPAEVSVLHGVLLADGRILLDRVQQCWKVATFLRY